LKLHVQRLGRDLCASRNKHAARIGLIDEDGEARNLWHDLQEHFQSFPAQVGVLCRQPRDVPTRAPEARDESCAHRVSELCHDDGDRARRLFGRQARWRARRDDNVDLERNQLGRKTGKPVGFPLSKSRFKGDVLSFQVAQLAQP